MVDKYPLTVYIEYRKGVFILCTQAKENESAQTSAACTGGCAACVKHKHRDKESKEYKCLISRLRRIAGQVRGVEPMGEADRYCGANRTQVSAIRSARGAFTKELLSQHIRTCVVDDIRAGHDEVVDELVATLQKVMK